MKSRGKTRLPETAARRFLTACGTVELLCVLQHAGFTVLALTSGQAGSGPETELLRAMTYCSPLLAVLSFCGAALAFSGRTATRRPGLAGASFLVLALACALLVAGCAILLIRHAGLMALVWPMSLAPAILPMVFCRLLFRSAQQNRHAGPDPRHAEPHRAGTDTTR